jgi:hypothetical protein
LKEAGVLLIVLVMVLSTVVVAGNTLKNDESNKSLDSEEYIVVESIEGSEILSQLYER